MKRRLRFPAILFGAALLLVSCNDRGQGADHSGQDTNYTDTRRNSGDTSYYLKTDSANQKDLVDPDVPEE